MHYVLLCHKLTGGGIQAVVRTQASSLVEAGHEVTVICNKESPNQHNYEFDTQFIAFQERSGRKKLSKLIKNSLYEVRILAHTFDAYWAMFWLRTYRNHTYNFIHVDYHAMYYENGRFLKNIERTLNFKLLFNNRNLVFVSKGTQSSFLTKIGVKPKRSEVIYPPIDFKKIAVLALNDTEYQLTLRPGKCYISVGRLVKRKNTELLINAFAKTRETNDYLIILGDGGEAEILKKLVQQIELNDFVLFLGWKENPYPYIKNADCLLMSSNAEGLGINIVESFFLGTPVISTDAPSGPREILGEKYKDCLAEVGNLDSFINVIQRFKTMQNQQRFKPEQLKQQVADFEHSLVIKKLLAFTQK